MRKLTIEEFIKNSILKHDNKYDYSKSIYTNSRSKIIITCKDHGDFEQTASSHMRGNGCLKCSGSEQLSTEDFIDKSIKIHNNKYDYSKVKYSKAKGYVDIICPYHHTFKQKANSHLNGHGCPYCGGTSKNDNEKFISKSIEVHGGKYDYSLVEYINNNTKVKIICNEHGIFEQRPNNHMRNQGCPYCGGSKQLTTEDFIRRSNEIHNYKYDYKLVKYNNNRIKVDIICHDHGVFSQSPKEHLKGSGCTKCYISKGEIKISKYLDEFKIEYQMEKKFEDLGQKRFDFYLPNLNICIEYDGIQHFEPVEFFGGKDKFNKLQMSDEMKNQYCKVNNIGLIRIPYWDYDNIEERLKSIL
jgi:hypothetical protein